MKTYGWKLVARIGLILTLLVCGWPVMSVRAASTWMVTKSDDSNDGTCYAADCSLREAIAAAVDGDVISFDGNYTIYLNSQLDLNKSLTIDGRCARSMTAFILMPMAERCGPLPPT